MIENPRDLNLIAIALRVAILANEHVDGNPLAIRAYRKLLDKVESLRTQWRKKRREVPHAR